MEEPLFNPARNSLPANYRTIITEAFAEVVPELRPQGKGG